MILTIAGESLRYFQKLLKLINKQLMVNKEIDPEDLKIVMKSEETLPFMQLLQNINIIQQVLFCGEIQKVRVLLQFQNYRYKECGLVNNVYSRVYEDIGNIFIRRLRNFIMELPSFID